MPSLVLHIQFFCGTIVYMRDKNIKGKIIALRKSGKTYGEIQKFIGENLPKSTLSSWCSDIKVPKSFVARVDKIRLDSLKKARAKAILAKQRIKKDFLHQLELNNEYLIKRLSDIGTHKLLLSVLYLGEGSKYSATKSLRLGSSDPYIITMYLKLLYSCYDVDPRKFRVRIQCRADQNKSVLEQFWQKVTKIKIGQFYPTWADARTKGKPTKKRDYKGVCVIDYFDVKIQQELEIIATKIINRGL